MIKGLELSNDLQLLTGIDRESGVGEKQELSFVDMLKEQINGVNSLKIEADKLNADFTLGKTDNIHQVMIATEKAKVALDLTAAIQNKAAGAYKEIMQMQM
ncbi:flagellar hook-basal body complex protein FliE [Iocasia frigidifontis]|uniref:Flagellar hook-basal body complex protein FliE n=1 Tax=Iocasia fonsfrigidae TaxID=2682810 RepID=A0A8A7KFL8_9FIRM|nr:flagellar hook-basal body complex protein FliE [Iocasia fonsfrigidae]MTI58778.1 flagellar hook-basal body complex protein FliE [Bacillota bacterium]QTL96954.1 flagellar hook-basal body complex protein FliE [Iocasia fonsfrigidae]